MSEQDRLTEIERAGLEREFERDCEFYPQLRNIKQGQVGESPNRPQED